MYCIQQATNYTAQCTDNIGIALSVRHSHKKTHRRWKLLGLWSQQTVSLSKPTTHYLVVPAANTRSCLAEIAHMQARSYVQARGGSMPPRSSSFKLFWDTNKCNEKLCKKKKIWQKESYKHLLFKLHEIWLVAFLENRQNSCHQMSDFIAKMYHIRFRLGFRPRPRWGSLQRSSDS